MKKQKWLVLLLAVVFVLSSGVLAACGEEPAPVTYTVTFNTDGGSSVANQTVETGKTATAPTSNPTKEGYTFKGWFKEAAGTTAFDFKAAITANTTVYAAWTKNETPVPEPTKFTVTFEVNGGSAVAALTVEEGKLATKPADPTKKATAEKTYEFAGWFTDAACTVAADFSKAISANVTFYAKWTEKDVVKPVTFTITFDTIKKGASAVEALTVEIGKVAAKPADPTLTGYTFDAWYKDKALQYKFDFSEAITGDITLYANWKINTYTLKLESSYAQGVAGYSFTSFFTYTTNEAGVMTLVSLDKTKAMTVPYGTKIAFVAKLDTTKVGSGLSLVMYKDGVVLGTVEQESVTYFVFTVGANDPVITGTANYVVSFDGNNGVWGNDTTVSSIVINGSVTLPTDPTRKGYTFAGWFNEAECKTAFKATEIVGNKTAYAKWTVNSFAVSAVSQETGVTVELSNELVEFGKTVGLRVIDTRPQTASPLPLVVKVNGVRYDILVDAEGARVLDRTYSIKVDGATDITVNAEYNYDVQMPFSASNIKFFEESEAITAGITAKNLAVTDDKAITSTTLLQKGIIAGEKVVFYILVAAGKTPTYNGDQDIVIEDLKLSQVAVAENAETEAKEAQTAGNWYKVTFTAPTKDNPYVLNINMYNFQDTTLTEYKVTGLNVDTVDFILQQFQVVDPTTKVVTLSTNPVTTFNIQNYTQYEAIYKQVAFIVKADKKFIVKLNGVTLLDTATAPAAVNKYVVDGVEYAAYIIDASKFTLNVTADQVWTVEEYHKVETFVDGTLVNTEYIKHGSLFTRAAVKNAAVVKVDGVAINGVVESATTKTYNYQVDKSIRVDVLSKFSIVYITPGGSSPVEFSNTAETVLYGETIHFTATGVKSGNILYVMAANGEVLGTATKKAAVSITETSANVFEGTYEVKIDAADYEGQVLYIIANFTTEWASLSTDGSTFIKTPIEFLKDVATPSKVGSIFNGWNVFVKDGTTPSKSNIATAELTATNVTKEGKVIAQFAAIKPTVTIATIAATTPFNLASVMVDGKKILAVGQSGGLDVFDTYVAAMFAGYTGTKYTTDVEYLKKGVALNFSQSIVVELERNIAVSLDPTKKVVIKATAMNGDVAPTGTTEKNENVVTFEVDANGIATVDLSKLFYGTDPAATLTVSLTVEYVAITPII